MRNSAPSHAACVQGMGRCSDASVWPAAKGPIEWSQAIGNTNRGEMDSSGTETASKTSSVSPVALCLESETQARPKCILSSRLVSTSLRSNPPSQTTNSKLSQKSFYPAPPPRQISLIQSEVQRYETLGVGRLLPPCMQHPELVPDTYLASLLFISLLASPDNPFHLSLRLPYFGILADRFRALGVD